MDKKQAAKDLAIQLRKKADELESLDEQQLAKLHDELNGSASAVNGSCTFHTPCILKTCVFNSKT